MLTPFELFLKSELDNERLRFGSEWVFKWHQINIEGRSTDVDDFKGGRIRLGGVKFDGQPQAIYWNTLRRYLQQKIHSTFRQWDEKCREYSATQRISSLDGTAGLLESFVGQLVEKAADTDRRLRGRGYPQNVAAYNPSKTITSARVEIIRLQSAFRAQLIEAAGNIMSETDTEFDVFISHASEDKDSIARPLADELKRRGLRVWYDETALGWGCSLRREIDAGLANSRFGVVILSEHFFSKEWPQAELDGLLTKEMNGGERLLPIWHNITRDAVERFSPILASKMARNSVDRSVEQLAVELVSICRRSPVSILQPTTRTEYVSISDGLKKWHSAGRREFEAEIEENSVPKYVAENNIQFSYAISTNDGEVLDAANMVQIVSKANRDIRDRVNTGWSMFYPFPNSPNRPFSVTDDEYTGGEIEILESSLSRNKQNLEGSYDLWRISVDGAATLLRPIRSDYRSSQLEGVKPKEYFSPNDLMREVAEFVRHAEALSAAFGSPTQVAFRCEWRGLKGRDFIDPNRDWHSGHIGQSATRLAHGIWTVEQVKDEWSQIVASLIAPVVRVFRNDLELSSERVRYESSSWRPMGNHYP